MKIAAILSWIGALFLAWAFAMCAIQNGDSWSDVIGFNVFIGIWIFFICIMISALGAGWVRGSFGGLVVFCILWQIFFFEWVIRCFFKEVLRINKRW